MKIENWGITPTKQKIFKKKGIDTTEQLLRVFPKEYIDTTKEKIVKDGYSVLKTKIVKVKCKEDKLKTVIATCIINDGKESYLNVLYFRSEYMYDYLLNQKGKKMIICGKIEYSSKFNSYSCLMPVFFLPESMAPTIYPVYKFPNNTDEYMQETEKILLLRDEITEYINNDVLKNFKLLGIKEALEKAHRPSKINDTVLAKKRLLFDDLLYFAGKSKIASEKMPKTTEVEIADTVKCEETINSLPYTLTKDQAVTINQIIEKMKNKNRVNAIIQGDVGSGKTIIAFLLAITLAENGYQSVIMAPSKILAKQHFEKFKQLSDMPCDLLTSDIRQSSQKKIKERIKSGETKIIFGTSSLISDSMDYNNLALTVIDEEHKFGVIQREKIVEFASAGAHTISMSATPIPRTLANTIYNDNIDLYEIKDKPAGRKAVLSCMTDNISLVYKHISKEIALGHQIFVVCPQIDKNDDRPVLSVEEAAKLYKDFNVKCITGKTKATESNQIMEAFKNHEFDILIATSVIEVGVDIPNATTIVIHDADYFGLSALHQLRGRVGRNKEQSYCIFFTERPCERLSKIAYEKDGFEIAKIDLELRHSGDLLGVRQSGKNKYVELVLLHKDFYESTVKPAADILYDNGELKNVLDALSKWNDEC